MEKAKTSYELYGRQCGEGWNNIIQPLHDDLLWLGGAVLQIKEKLGGLRFYYSLPSKVSNAKRQVFERKRRHAEEASFSICERCGKPGELVRFEGHPLFTACKSCRDARFESSR